MNTENNKLIAEFLGSQYINKPYTDREGVINDFWHWTKPNCKIPHSIGIGELTTAWTIGNFHFHDDWNWLMEVVEKIESLGSCQIDISFNWCRVGYKGETFNYDSRTHFAKITKIEAVYNACVEFIKWYNENPAKEN